MKLLFTALSFILLNLPCQRAEAIALHCGTLIIDAPNYHNFLIDKVGDDDHYSSLINCSYLDLKLSTQLGVEIDSNIQMKMKGVGLGMRATFAEGFLLNCPLILNRERLLAHPFYGLKLAAGLGVGGTVGIFSNKRGGICILTALNSSVGADLSGVKLEFGSW